MKTTAKKNTDQVLTISFTDKGKQQLERLQKHFKLPHQIDVLKLGISFLQSVKEGDDAREQAKIHAYN